MSIQSLGPIVGIDLGTTNSVVAAYIDGKVQVIAEDGTAILPSVVGKSLDGKLIVGQVAKNQLAAFPERTISSIKRKMGQAVQVSLGDQSFSPQEISAIVLRRLRQRAEQFLGTCVTRAVITVPAFFDENQRQATREAGELAGLTVERIINEPTAASLVYHSDSPDRRHLIVYDLGGGTFDVSIVRIEAGVVEVLSSKGDTQLGGDDFDELLARHVSKSFATKYGLDLLEQSSTRWRLMQACERAKCELSSLGTAHISEEFIATIDNEPVNLDIEVSRREYEDLIEALVDRTIKCVDQAIRDSGLAMVQLDELILVGGSTRTPLVQKRLRDEFHRDPHWSVNPDLAVALGAATQAAMQDGYSVGPVLIDVATHTLGTDVIEPRGLRDVLTFAPIIRRNTPLPARHEEIFFKMHEDQDIVVIKVYQGESDNLEQNPFLGSFSLEGLAEGDASCEILVRFELTLDGTLEVTAVERATGMTKSIQISNALSKMELDQRDAAQERLANLFEGSEGFQVLAGAGEEDDGLEDFVSEHSADLSEERSVGAMLRVDTTQDVQVLRPKWASLLEKAKGIRSRLSNEDGQDVDRLVGLIETAAQSNNLSGIASLEAELEDLLFYVS